MGAEHYTLTYQPFEGDANGKFRQIRVTLRDPNLRAVTKDGYYAPDKNIPDDPRQRMRAALFEAAQSTIPFAGLDVKVTGIVRHPESATANFTVQLKLENIPWLGTDDGKSTANMRMAGASLSGARKLLASNVVSVILTANTQDPARLAATHMTAVNLSLPIPRKTKVVRIVMSTDEGGRMGTAELDRKTIDAAPAQPPPEMSPAPVPVN